MSKVFTLCTKITASGKVQNEFPTFTDMIQKAENIVLHLQLLETEEMNCTVVIQYVVTPDKKDFVTIKASGIKTLERKRPSNVKEMYTPLKSTHPKMNLGL